MDKKERLNMIIDHYCDGKPTMFAKLLGVAPSTISSWLSRNVLDYDLIFAKCELLSAHWLITGEGDMLKSENNERHVITEVVYKSDPRDLELISSKNEIIETQKELILSLKQRIQDLECNSSPRADAFPSAHSVASTGGTYQSKKTK